MLRHSHQDTLLIFMLSEEPTLACNDGRWLWDEDFHKQLQCQAKGNFVTLTCKDVRQGSIWANQPVYITSVLGPLPSLYLVSAALAREEMYAYSRWSRDPFEGGRVENCLTGRQQYYCIPWSHRCEDVLSNGIEAWSYSSGSWLAHGMMGWKRKYDIMHRWLTQHFLWDPLDELVTCLPAAI